ncbi:MAG: hypothetical protein WCF84_25760 [Anaerolineae bacterium]
MPWTSLHGFENPQEIVLSPDGDKLAFIGLTFPLNGEPTFSYYHLFVGNLDETRFHPLTDIHQRIEPIFDPSWSPDGKWVAVAKTHPHNGVGIARSDGSGVTWLTEETVPEFPHPPDSLNLQISSVTPVWFRDSSHLLFLVALHGEAASALYRVKPDGTELVKLQDRDVYAPTISPDGTRLAFASYDDENQRNSGIIVITDLNAQSPREIVRMEHPDNQKMLIRDLAWSPDGTRLAFAANPKGNMDLFVVNADGTDLRDITGWPGDEIAPRWRPRP